MNRFLYSTVISFSSCTYYYKTRLKFSRIAQNPVKIFQQSGNLWTKYFARNKKFWIPIDSNINSSDLAYLNLNPQDSQTSNIVTASFLPQGYPESVHSFFLPYSTWFFLQNIIGSAIYGIKMTFSFIDL